MFGLGWSELVLIGIVALIVVGPKDLPNLFRSVGQFTGKARGMAREFSKAMEDAARESGISDVEKTIRAAANPAKFGTDALRNSALSAIKPGGETEKLSKEREEMRARIEEATAKAATGRLAREAAAAARKADAAEAKSPDPAPKPAPKKRASAKVGDQPAPAAAKPAAKLKPKSPKADT